jgi:hypothetical protein
MSAVLLLPHRPYCLCPTLTDALAPFLCHRMTQSMASCRLWLLILPSPPLGPFPYDAVRHPRPVVVLRHASISNVNQPLVLLLLLPQQLVVLSLPSPLRPSPLPDLLPLSPASNPLSLTCDSHRSSTQTHSLCWCFCLRSDRAASAPSTLAGTLAPHHPVRVWHLVKLLELGIL